MQKKQHANLCERLYYEIISNFGRQQLCDREATFPVGRTMKCYILTSLALRYVGVAICTRSFNLVSLYSVRVLVVYVRAQRHYLLLSTPKCVKVVRHTLSWYDVQISGRSTGSISYLTKIRKIGPLQQHLPVL